ncbi:hypothetical protein L2E82_39557 [Cichorium intybus]|uniref:Uncharacterized protein n=1 Tax=Cichorium intybus TaxID=13427 RepID=A0ACB9AII6_CICIN|nr:hypothetical protein L2E82_39557 [Cichorium intybus]
MDMAWISGPCGSDQTISDFTYMENVAHALICAEAALSSRMLIVSRKVFLIINFEPAKSWQFALEGLGYYRPIIKLPVVVDGIALTLQIFYSGEMRGDHSYGFLELVSYITGFL